jgi:hypothetical protein
VAPGLEHDAVATWAGVAFASPVGKQFDFRERIPAVVRHSSRLRNRRLARLANAPDKLPSRRQLRQASDNLNAGPVNGGIRVPSGQERFTADEVASHALRCLAAIACLSRAEAERVLRHPMKPERHEK